MKRLTTLACAFAAALSLGLSAPAAAQDPGPLKLDITRGVIEPLPLAIPDFIAETPQAAEFAKQISDVISQDLVGSGLFREISPDAYISQVTNFNAPVSYTDWKAINAQGLVTGAVSMDANGALSVKFRVFDIYSEAPLGSGLQLGGSTTSWRRIAHKVADVVYSRITGEGGYFDSRVVFVSQTGPKNDRKKRLAVMDYDGANVQYLTDDSFIVFAPRFSPTGDRVLYTSYENGTPQIMMLDVGTVTRTRLPVPAESVTFAPRFSPDGQAIVYSMSTGTNTDLYRMDIASGQITRLTNTPAIETAPSFSPDGSRIVFESDRSGTQQLYVMPAGGGEAQRISNGIGRYGTPVWSPRGDLIAFTKQNQGRFHIGVMRTDGSEERLLTASFLDEGPSWAPNGRVLMFTRESQGAGGESALYTVDITGRNLKRVPTMAGASDPAWSPLMK